MAPRLPLLLVLLLCWQPLRGCRAASLRAVGPAADAGAASAAEAPDDGAEATAADAAAAAAGDSEGAEPPGGAAAPPGDAIAKYLRDAAPSSGGGAGGAASAERLAELALRAPPRNATAEAAAPRRTVVVAKYDEDTGWLRKLPANFDVVVYQSQDASQPHFVENLGNEAAKYLAFIVDRYDAFPEAAAFVHAGRQDWHDPWPKDVLLRSWDWDRASQRGGMASLPTNAPCLVEDSVKLPPHETPAAPAGEQCVAMAEHFPKQMAAIREAWPAVFESELGPLPQRWLTHCCAQFVVTREAVRRHPRDFYSGLLAWALRHDRALLQSSGMARNHHSGRRDAGHVLEPLWALLFASEDSTAMTPPLPGAPPGDASLAGEGFDVAAPSDGGGA